jgi:hypothetical protein
VGKIGDTLGKYSTAIVYGVIGIITAVAAIVGFSYTLHESVTVIQTTRKTDLELLEAKLQAEAKVYAIERDASVRMEQMLHEKLDLRLDRTSLANTQDHQNIITKIESNYRDNRDSIKMLSDKVDRLIEKHLTSTTAPSTKTGNAIAIGRHQIGVDP